MVAVEPLAHPRRGVNSILVFAHGKRRFVARQFLYKESS
jgi:hypothetical protein